MRFTSKVNLFFGIFLLNELVVCEIFGNRPQVTISHGTIVGKYMETISKRKISAFLGIPYAGPPVGKLRFKDPIQPAPWQDPLQATSLAPICLQYEMLKDTDKIIGVEDCLHLNVYVPEDVEDHKNNLLPVIVNIHGGAFMVFSGSYYGPEYLRDKNVILVSINYRLGILGFLSTEDDVVPGNIGLKDQQFALKWVKNNIRAFGGDPNKVTILGMSAGAASVDYLLLSPGSRGLFNRAIILSGSALCPWAQAEKVKQKSQIIALDVGCPIDSSQRMVDCLQEKPGFDLVNSSSQFMVVKEFLPFSPFGPVIEPSHPNAFIDKPPAAIIKSGLASDVPILISVMKDEGLFPGAAFIAENETSQYLDDNWNELMPHILDYNFTVSATLKSNLGNILKKEYLGSETIINNHKGFIDLIGDRLFKYPVSQAAKLYAANNKSPVHAMQFSYIGNIRSTAGFLKDNPDLFRGAPHGDDLSYVLRSADLILDDDEPSMEMSKRMVDLFVNFVEGHPFPKNWGTVNENLPMYSYLNVDSPDPATDAFVQEKDFARESFWSTLKIKEDYGFDTISHDEL